MNESELEDLEAHLYSQVYHSKDATEEVSDVKPDNKCFVKPAAVPTSSARYWGCKLEISSTSHVNHQFKAPQPQGHQQQPNSLVNPVALKQVKVPLTPKQQLKLANKKAKNKEKRRQMREAKNREKRNLMRAQKKAINREQNFTHNNAYLNFIKSCINDEKKLVSKNTCTEVITLSDSDENDDSCLIVDNKWPCLAVVDSEDEEDKTEQVCNESQSDDIIFVEPVAVSLEVINLDEESECSLDIANKSRIEALNQLKQDRKELLRTPDSTSNDFMNSSGVDKQTKFNFSQHGSDFNNEILKASKTNESCETESTSSTTDVHSVNVLKTIVFSEVEFPRDIFSENNLEAFGNFITPLRSSEGNHQSSPIRPQNKQQTETVTKARSQVENNSSDSSSESELEDSSYTQKGLTRKCLPELSPMLPKKGTSISKKTQNKASSVVLETSKQEDQTRSASKKKKNKKKKADCDNSSDSNTLVESNSEDLKVRKRKSSQMEAPVETVDQPKKKNKNKNKKSSTGEDQGVDVRTENKQAEKEDANRDNQQKSVAEEIKQDDAKIDDSKVSKPETLMKQKTKTNDLVNLTTESCTKPSETQNHSQSASLFDGLIVIDETFATNTVESSDSESVLSVLNEPGDIQLINCKEQLQQVTPSTSEDAQNLKDFDVAALQHSMSSDPKLWKILDTDRAPLLGRRAKRCNRCKELGHNAYKCPNRITPKCKICGDVGHFEPRCPNKLCNQCGKQSPYSTTYCKTCFKLRSYQCPLCSMTGHLPEKCPDLWRRYHLTITDGPLTTYDGPVLKLQQEMWCSGCAQPGHLQHACTYYSPIYPPADPFIKRYEDVYVDQTRPEVTIPPENDVNYAQNDGYIQQYDAAQGFFINNQQNFFYNADPMNVFQYPAAGGHGYGAVYNNFNYQNNVPNYMSFEAPLPPQEPYEQIVPMMHPNRSSDQRALDRMVKRHNSVFFSSTTRNLQQFIQIELGKLLAIGYDKDRRLREFKKGLVPRDFKGRSNYYQSLNMLLFGVYKLSEGKMHVERLKTFKMTRLFTKLNHHERNKLYRSYNYVFGVEQHRNVDYNELLSRI